VIQVVATEIVDLVPFAPEAMYGLTTIIPVMIRLARTRRTRVDHFGADTAIRFG
jgi:hypothetical protein